MIWLTINSSATGERGDLDGVGANACIPKVGGSVTASQPYGCSVKYAS